MLTEISENIQAKIRTEKKIFKEDYFEMEESQMIQEPRVQSLYQSSSCKNFENTCQKNETDSDLSQGKNSDDPIMTESEENSEVMETYYEDD